MEAANATVPFAVISRLLPPLSCSASPVPDKPDMVTLTVWLTVTHVVVTVTFPALIVPEPLATLHICCGEDGCVFTLTW
jgi:hypothetical protein